MVGILGNQYVSQKAGTRQTTLNRPRRSRRFDNTFATCAGELRPHMTNDLVGCRHAFQLFGDIFTELAQRTTAIGAAVVSRKMGDHFTRQIFWQRLARRARARLRG